MRNCSLKSPSPLGKGQGLGLRYQRLLEIQQRDIRQDPQRDRKYQRPIVE